MPHYLGDGVYIVNDGFHYILYTSNGIERTNTIYLDPQVIHALLAFLGLKA